MTAETPQDFSSVAVDVAPFVSPRQEVPRVGEALVDFTNDLSRLNGVFGVAFLRADQPFCPATLSIQVIAQLRHEGKLLDTVNAVVSADGTLAEKISSVVPGELQLIDSIDEDINSLRKRLEKQWEITPRVKLLAFIRFERKP